MNRGIKRPLSTAELENVMENLSDLSDDDALDDSDVDPLYEESEDSVLYESYDEILPRTNRTRQVWCC